MRERAPTPTLSTTRDWLTKAEHDLSRFQQTNSVYAMADCFLSLNALVEWLHESQEMPKELVETAKQKVLAMQSAKRDDDFDEHMLDDIDLIHRAVRAFCNHAKHSSTENSKRPITSIEMHANYPIPYSITFERITIKGHSIVAEDLLRKVLDFWKTEFGKYA